jgi:hypothetical protein
VLLFHFYINVTFKIIFDPVSFSVRYFLSTYSIVFLFIVLSSKTFLKLVLIFAVVEFC